MNYATVQGPITSHIHNNIPGNPEREPQIAPQIARAMNDSISLSSELEETIAKLEARLSPVLSPTGPEQGGAPRPEQTCALAESICGLNDRTRNSIDRLRSLTLRIEL